MTIYDIKSLRTDEGIHHSVGQRVRYTVPRDEATYVTRMLTLIPKVLRPTLQKAERFFEDPEIMRFEMTVRN